MHLPQIRAGSRIHGYPRVVARQRSVGWRKDGAIGLEWADLTLDHDRLAATIVAIGADPLPYRLDATLETDGGWVTRRLRVTTRGGDWERELDLGRGPDGRWSIDAHAAGRADLPAPGGPPGPLDGALDCDLGLSPVTNTMPVLREGLLRLDGERTFTMAWVEVPSLRVIASRQGYATRGHDPAKHRRIEYRSLDGDFTSIVTFDADGLVVDYPQLARRLREPGQPPGR
jgi:hypothetical protein